METQGKVLMRQANSLIIFFSRFTALFFILGLPLTSYADPIVQDWQNHTGSHEGLILEPRFSYYSTSANYDATSKGVVLLNGTSVTRFYFDLNFDYGLSNDFFVFGRLSLLSTKASTTGSLSGTTTPSSFGLSDQLVGLAYRLFHTASGFNINIQGDATLPAYQNTTQLQQGNPYFGDQSVDLTLGSFVEIPFTPNVYLEAGGGYEYRSKGYSAAIPYSLLIKRNPVQAGMMYSLGVRGQFSLKSDQTPVAIAAQESANGASGSYLVGALNPQWMIGQGSLGYKNGSGQVIYALLATSISGTNAPQGMQISLGTVIDLGPHEREAEPDSEAEKTTAPAARKKLARPDQFTTYDLNSEVVSVNDSFYMIKINKGADDGVEKGQFFDIFRIKEEPITGKSTETLIARAKVTHLKGDQAALTVVEYYVDQWIESGFAARRVVQ